MTSAACLGRARTATVLSSNCRPLSTSRRCCSIRHNLPADRLPTLLSLSYRHSAGPPSSLRRYTTSSAAKSNPSKSSQNTHNEPDDRPELDGAVSHVKKSQIKTPWLRDGSQTPPVKRDRDASAMTKGKLLTTPSRLLKLILPVTTHDYNNDRKDIEPLALLLHPQQPLSYLERLIQAEIPALQDEKGNLHPPKVSFLAVDMQDESIQPKKSKTKNDDDQTQNGEEQEDLLNENRQNSTGIRRDPQVARLGEFPKKESADRNIKKDKSKDGNNSRDEEQDTDKDKPQDPEASRKAEKDKETEAMRCGQFVRWSSSTEIGDFIRDAARVKEFLVDIENSALGKIPVAVPSFNDRTYYLRLRLRKLSKRLKNLAIIKQECDVLAHRGAQRVALGGFGVMVSWWYIVYKLTFETDYGWDTMEPITYLVSLSTLMAGYAWFLYHNREISYRSALDFTVNRRQQKLYQAQGIDLQVWEALIEEANFLRREIKTVAEEYDVDWDERADEEDERVTEALKDQRRQKDKREEEERKQEKKEERKEKG